MATRRDFIKCCSALTVAGAAGFSRLGLMQALAQTTADYKALVCVFLFGGNDGNNLIVPFDSAAYQQYATIRGGTGALALDQTQLRAIAATNQNGNYALHPSL